VQRLLPGLAGLVFLGLGGLVVAAAQAGEITASGGGLSLGTRVNGQMGGSCGAGDCGIGGGTKAGPNLFHRFAAFDTRGGIRSVLFDTQGQRNLVVGVVNPLGSFLDKPIGLSSPASLIWLSPGGIHLGGGAGFVNIPSLQLSTATSLRVGGGMFDVMRTTAAQAAQLSGEPLAGRAGLVSDPASLAAASLSANGDVTLSGGLLTVDHELLLDAQGGHVLLQGGQIKVPGGSVELAGRGVSVAPGVGVSVSSASSSASGGGTIRAQAGSGALEVAGSLEARGEALGAAGGRIELSGSTVALRGARLEASGPAGGGTVLVGGGLQGGDGAVANAQATLVDGASTIRADATEKGKGGTVGGWADRATQVDGSISARGGSQGGDGGFVETSGKQQLAVSRAPDASAPQGKGGTWLLDPTDVTINATGGALDGSNAFTSGPLNSIIGADVIKTALNAGSSVVISTGAGGTQAGDITVVAPITKTAGADASLSLNAHNNITINASITSTAGKLGLTLKPDSDANGSGASTLASGVTLSLNGGTAVFSGTSSLAGTVNVGTLSATGGKTTLESSGMLTAAQINLSDGTLAFNGAATTPSFIQTGGELGGSGNLTLTGAGNTWSGGAWSGGGTVTLSEGASLTASGSESGTSLNWHTLTINKGASATFASDLMIENGEKIINNAGILTLLGAGSFSDSSIDFDLGPFTLNNSGLLIKSDLGAYSLGIIELNNTGTLNVQAGTLVIPNSNMLSQSGTLNLASSSTFSTAGGFTNRGTISGTGTMDVGPSTLINEGTISPGGTGAAGTLTINGSLTLTSSSLLEIDLGISTSGASIGGGLQHDRLIVSGNASLGGTLTATLAPGYTPLDGTTADILVAATTFSAGSTSLPSGSFTTTNLPGGFSGTTVIPPEAPTPTYRLSKAAPLSPCAGVCWDGDAGDNLWSTATNWSRDTLPGISDTAYLNLLGGASVLFNIESVSVAALFSEANNSLTIAGGRLVFNDPSLSPSIQGALNVAGGNLVLNNASVDLRDLTLSAGSITGSAAVAVSSNLQQAAGTSISLGSFFATQSTGVMTLDGSLSSTESLALLAPAGGLDIGGSLSSTGPLLLSGIGASPSSTGPLLFSGMGASGIDGASGIRLRSGSSLTSASSISLTGIGGGDASDAHGVHLMGEVRAGSGLTISGQGGAGLDRNVGVVQDRSSVITVLGGSGLTLTGSAQGSGASNRGVELRGLIDVEGGEGGGGGTVVTAIGSPFGSGSGNGGLLLDGATLVNTDGVLSLNGIGGLGTDNLEGVRITGSSIRVSAFGPASLEIVGTASAGGVGVDVDADLSVSGPLRLRAETGSLNMAGALEGSRILATAATGLNLASETRLTANDPSGVTLQLSAGSGAFSNSAGSAPFSVADRATWQVYSASPFTPQENLGGLVYDFKQYGRSFADAMPVAGSGNGFFYAFTPSLVASLSGSTSKVYDGSLTAVVDPAQVQFSGVVPGDAVRVGATGPAFYDSRDVGSGKLVTLTGVGQLTASEGSIPVYGYQVNQVDGGSAPIGVITPATVFGGFSVEDKIFDGSTAATILNRGLFGAVPGDQVALVGGTARFITPDVGSLKPVLGTGFQLIGADRGNYTLSDLITVASILPVPPQPPRPPDPPQPPPDPTPPPAPTSSLPPATTSPPPPLPPPQPTGQVVPQLLSYPIFGVLQLDPLTELLAGGSPARSPLEGGGGGGGPTPSGAGGTTKPTRSANPDRSSAEGGRGILNLSSVSDLGSIFNGSDLPQPEPAARARAGAAAAPVALPGAPSTVLNLADPAEAYSNAERKAPAIAEQLGLGRQKEDQASPPSSLSLQEWMQRNASAVRRGAVTP